MTCQSIWNGLPIDSRLSDIMALLDDYPVVIVKAETGSGKTTRLSQAALRHAPDRPVVMTQPHRPAVRWNGRRIAAELGCKPGELIGWRLFGETPRISDQTRLELTVVQGLADRICAQDGQLPEGLIIVDEAHERSVSIDLLLGLIKNGLPSSPRTRVLITSATLDAQKFSDFFDGAPVVNVTGRCYPVSTEVVRLRGYEHHSEGAARAALEVMEQFIAGELTVPTPDNTGTQVVTKGTVIVLLPGKDDITSVMSSLEAGAKDLGAQERVEILGCHGQSLPKQQDAIQSPLEEGTLRIACGTEVLRSSVTVPNTVGVIDSLQIKRVNTNPQGVARFAKVPVSQAQAEQAKGRAGREAPGFYRPISFQNEYENLPHYPPPEIQRAPIIDVVLLITAAGLAVKEFPFMDPLPADKLAVALDRLKRFGALDEQGNITQRGRQLVRFPIDPERAMVLVTAGKLGVLSEAVVAMAALEAEGFFQRPRDLSLKLKVSEPVARLILSQVTSGPGDTWILQDIPGDPAAVTLECLPPWMSYQAGEFEVDCGHTDFPHRQRSRWVVDLIFRAWAGDSQSDFVGLVQAYRAFKTEEARLEEFPANKKHKRGRETRLRAWCNRHYLNYNRIRIAEDVMRLICDELEGSPLCLTHDIADRRDFDTTALTQALASGLMNHIARRAKSGSGIYIGPVGRFALAHQSACPPRDVIVVGRVRQVPSAKGGKGIQLTTVADIAAPLEEAPGSDSSRALMSTPHGTWNSPAAKDAALVALAAHFNG